MAEDRPLHPFLREVGRILNAGLSHTVVVSGNIHDLYFLPEDGGSARYTPLIELVTTQWRAVRGRILIAYELNRPLRFMSSADRDKVKEAWSKWRTGLSSTEVAKKRMLLQGKSEPLATEQSAFEECLQKAQQSPSYALEFLRQLCVCSRATIDEEVILPENLTIIIGRADMVIPEGEITKLSESDRHRAIVCHDWFTDPDFLQADDAVVAIAESRSLLNHEIARLPQVLQVEIPAPDMVERSRFIAWFRGQSQGSELKVWSTDEVLATLTAGLSIHALRQLLVGAVYDKRQLDPKDVVKKVEEYIIAQLGEDVVEFSRPEHRLDAVIGFTTLKKFLVEEFIPRIRSSGLDTLTGAAVAGPIGGGKTFNFEAVAAELGIAVLVLKNLRSQWYGGTDVIFERLRRVLLSLMKVLIFIDEADTQFGGVGQDVHETERRLTGKLQQMMSDTKLRGKVHWLLMTARINALSPDIRRPGRAGDLIIPVLDPEGDDRNAFITWMLKAALPEVSAETVKVVDEKTKGYSAASFDALRRDFKAKAGAKGSPLTVGEVLAIIQDRIPPAIGKTRRYQTLQALVNCTRRSLLPDPNVTDVERQKWEAEIRQFEAEGIR